MWSDITHRSYFVLTAHFIDASWTLCSKNFALFRIYPGPHNGKDMCKFVLDLLGEWGIKNKVFSLTCDNASSNGTCCGI